MMAVRASPTSPSALAQHLGERAASLARTGPGSLDALGTEGLLTAWNQAIEALRCPQSPDGRILETGALRSRLETTSGLSSAGLDAALEVVLMGVAPGPSESLVAEARRRTRRRGLVALVVASNIPALAVQPLLPALALGHPVLIKSPSAEPDFAPALARALKHFAPELGDAVGAVTWKGGDRHAEAAVFPHCSHLLAYGDAHTLADLTSRLAPPREATRHGGSLAVQPAPKLLGFGPKLSLAIVDAHCDPSTVADGLATDIALFDQRGCLSVQAIYTAGDPSALAHALAGSLRERARVWPPGRPELASLTAVQALRAVAAMKGLEMPSLSVNEGTVIIEPDPRLRTSPGLRTVRIHPLDTLSDVPSLLASWRDRLQGAALGGDHAWALAPALERLGISRCAQPGTLQDVDTSWHNGGRSPLDLLG